MGMTTYDLSAYNLTLLPGAEMATTFVSETMTKRADVPVKMDSEVVRKAKIVAAYRGQSLAEFLSNTLGEIVDGLLAAEHAKETGGKHAKKGAK